MSEYVQPQLELDGFHCPSCGVYAHQSWFNVHFGGGASALIEGFRTSRCARCKAFSIWQTSTGALIYPGGSGAPLPNPDMPVDVRYDYEEARNVVNGSPRAAAALLRLALEKLVAHLGAEGRDLNDRIGHLVSQGLRPSVQQALDALRVIGNNAVHPGEIALKDDHATATALFRLLNVVVDEMITKPNEVEDIFDIIPDSQKEAIQKRDGN
jgi:hypothetical protein